MIQWTSRFWVFLVCLLVVTWANCGEKESLYFIDAHSQVDQQVLPLDKIIDLMRQAGVHHTILSSRGKLKGKDLLSFSSRYRDKITPAVRTKGKHYDTASSKYYKSIESQVASGKYSAIAEILLYHAKKGDKAPEYVVYPEDKRVLTALEHAIDNHWPFIVHIEFGSLYGKKRKRFMVSLEAMLDDYPDQPFVLTHMGQLKPEECQRLIDNHVNIHFHTGWTNPAAVRSSTQPCVNLFRGRRLAPDWRDLFIPYPERFVFALDNVFAEHWTDFYAKQMEYWTEALSDLPVEAAHLIAHGNAERLWHIPPRD